MGRKRLLASPVALYNARALNYLPQGLTQIKHSILPPVSESCLAREAKIPIAAPGAFSNYGNGGMQGWMAGRRMTNNKQNLDRNITELIFYCPALTSQTPALFLPEQVTVFICKTRKPPPENPKPPEAKTVETIGKHLATT